MNHTPEPLTALRAEAPMELERIVSKALQKETGSRYQQVEELLVDLRSLQRDTIRGKPNQPLSHQGLFSKKRLYVLSGIVTFCVLLAAGVYLFQDAKEMGSTLRLKGDMPGGQSKDGRSNSIAVLPFRNISPEAEQEYFCDGMTEQVITTLSNLRDLKVIARTSVMQFKNSEMAVSEIARQLGVAHVLEGSIRKSGNRIRITAKLIQAEGDFPLWARDYDRELKDVFEVQDDVARAIVTSLSLNLSDEQRLAIARRYTENTRAYETYLEGRFHLNKGTEQGRCRRPIPAP